jgi:hypothetical protein
MTPRSLASLPYQIRENIIMAGFPSAELAEYLSKFVRSGGSLQKLLEADLWVPYEMANLRLANT